MMASSSLNIYTVNIKIWLMLVLDITEMWIERDIVTVLTMANKSLFLQLSLQGYSAAPNIPTQESDFSVTVFKKLIQY